MDNTQNRIDFQYSNPRAIFACITTGVCGEGIDTPVSHYRLLSPREAACAVIDVQRYGWRSSEGGGVVCFEGVEE